MSRDRLVQLVALLVITVGLTGSMLLINPINAQRRDLQLTFAVDTNQADPPQYALLAAGLGSFRGVAVNALWYRAEMMKRDGQFAEANTLATWITYLQPRFPYVWGFLAWNMAYNISVETFTPQERYDWVNKGIKLLREEGIPYNPNSVRLYRELSWILLHKIGQTTDDVNWYYKGEFAREWEEILGAAPEQFTPEGVINEMGRIAQMADRFFAVDRPNVLVSFNLEEIAEAEVVPELTEQFDQLDQLGIIALEGRIQEMRDGLRPSDEEGIDALDTLLSSIGDQVSRAERDAATVFAEQFPRGGDLAQQLRERGLELDQRTLRAIGKCLMFLRFRDANVVAGLPPTLMPAEAQEVLPLVVEVLDTELGDGLSEAFFDELLPFLRAKVLIEDYRMQPVKMYQYMAPVPEEVREKDPSTPGGYGPLDWRHPHAHSLYWARLGVEQYFDLRDTDKVDILNTQRQALHSLQALSDAGSVSFNPFNSPGQQIDLLPDPDFLDAYFKIVEETQAMADNEELGVRIRAEAFEKGEENFLQKAVLYAYLYGNPAQANGFYRRLIDEYGDSAVNQQKGWYNLPMGDFVAFLIFEDDLGRPGMLSLINSRFVEAFRKGLAVGNTRGLNVFNQNMTLAQNVHRLYNEKFGYETGLEVGGGRLRLPPFRKMANDAFTQFMQDRQHDIFVRLNAYQTAYGFRDSLPFANQTYRQWEKSMAAELTALGIDPAGAMPPPPDVVETVEGADGQQGGTTIERQ